MAKYSPYKMKGHTLPGIKQNEGAKNLLKAVPNEEAYNKLSDTNKKGFDAAGKKAGLPQKKVKKSPAKIAPLIAMAGKAILGQMAGKVAGKVLGGKKEEEE